MIWKSMDDEIKLTEKEKNIIQERHCAKCGKPIVTLNPREWAYKDGTDYYCSWKCFNHRYN